MSRRVAKMMRRFLLVGGIGLAVGGCVHNWDEVTSRDFKFKDMFRPSDPMMVLRDNPDGDARAKAMAQLKEPKKQGGSDALQDEAVNRLASQAVSAPEPLCQLAAVDALGRFGHPR